MSSLFNEKREWENQEPLMDFADTMFGEFDSPKTITQEGLDADSRRARLNFNGKKMRLMIGDREIESWNAVSGKDGYQSPEFQYLKNLDRYQRAITP